MPTATTIVRRAAVRADRVADTVTLDRAGRAAGVGHQFGCRASSEPQNFDPPIATFDDGEDDGRQQSHSTAPQHVQVDTMAKKGATHLSDLPITN